MITPYLSPESNRTLSDICNTGSSRGKTLNIMLPHVLPHVLPCGHIWPTWAGPCSKGLWPSCHSDLSELPELVSPTNSSCYQVGATPIGWPHTIQSSQPDCRGLEATSSPMRDVCFTYSPRLLSLLAGGGARACRDVSWFAGDVYRIVCMFAVRLSGPFRW
jgi:hypothetical protein